MQNNRQRNAPLLPLSKFRVTYSYQEPLRLPDYPGSAWRGAFGAALKKSVCVVRNIPCTECLLKTSCAYSYLFETPPPANAEKMRKYNATPHPFVFEFDEGGRSELGVYQFNLIVFAHGLRFFPYIVYALQKAGSEGIGGHRQLFNLTTVEQQLSDHSFKVVYEDNNLQLLALPRSEEFPEMPDRIEIVIQSPMRIKQDGKNTSQVAFSFEVFFGNLLRRISMLSYFHTDTPLDIDFRELTLRAKTVQFNNSKLRWYDWTRYSSRQQTEMIMGGVMGSVYLEMSDLECFWPYLWLGQWTHVGKGTSMGMGAYKIVAL